MAKSIKFPEANREPRLREKLAKIRRACSDLPILDGRPADEILGYDENGLPS